MCLFNTPKVKAPSVPTPVDPNKVGADEADKLARKRAAAFGKKQTIGTSAQGAANFGQNVRPQVELMGQ